MQKSDITLKSDFFDRIAPILVFAALTIGALFRLSGLDDHTVDHNEIYIPGIALPRDISNPGPRLTLSDTITAPIFVECHPPGYYVVMLAWTKCFGTSSFSIRLPSVLFDVGTIVLIYILAVCVGMPKSGVIAAFLWATGGLTTYLAQEARMYPLTCFLGVLSTLLLVKSYGGIRSRRRRVIGAYVIALLAGVSTSHFFWLILMVHMLYVQFGPIPAGHRTAPQAQWQLFTLALASPLLAVAAFQSGRPSYLSPDVWASVQAYFRLLYVWYSGEIKVAAWLGGAASLGCALLLVIGVLRIHRQTRATNQCMTGCPRWLLYVVAVLALMLIEAFAWFTYRRRSEFTWLTPRTGTIVACGILPLLVLVADSVVRRGFLTGWLESCVGAPLGPLWLVTFLAIVPIGLLALVSMAIPLIAGRTVSLFAPYLFLMVALGAVRFYRKPIVCGLVITLLFSLNIAGFIEYRKLPHSPTDYATLAARVKPKVQGEDLFFVIRHWATTPIFYYLNPDQYTFVARDYGRILSEQPDARVWVLGFEDDPAPPRVTDPLKDYHQQIRVEARGIYVDLYVPVSEQPADSLNVDNVDTKSL